MCVALFAIAASKLSKDLGYGMPISSIISSVSFIVCLFLYLYIIGSFFKVTVHPLIDRVTVHVLFQGHVVNEHVDNITAIVAAILWLLFSLNNRAIRYSLCIAYGGIGTVLAIISPDNIIFDIIAMLSMPLIIGVSLYYYYYDHHLRYKQQKKKNILNFNAKLTLRYVSLAVIAMSAIGIVVPVSAVFLTPDLDSSAGRTALSASSQASPQATLFLLLSSFSTVYIFLLVSSLGVKALFKVGLRRLKLDIKEDISPSLTEHDDHYYEQNKLKTQTKIGFLLLAIVLSIVLVLVPQHPLVNKDNQNIGVDTTYYVWWIGELSRSKNAFDLIYQSFVVQGQNGDRPLSLLFLFLLYQVAGNTNLSEVIEHFPLILGPGIVLALYFLTLELTRNAKIALIAAFFAAVYVHTLVGIYAGFYANWLGLIVGYISLAFLFRYLRTGHRSDIVVFSTLLIGVLFIHVYTWTVLAAVAGIFLLVMLLVGIWDKKKKKKRNKDYNNNNISIRSSNSNNNPFTNRNRITWLLIAVLVSVGVDITKVLLTDSSGGLVQDVELAQTNLGIEQFNTRFDTLDFTMHRSLGGVFSNFIILILGLFWVLKSNIREPSTIFLMIFLSVGLIPLNIGSWILQVRVLYDIPFEIPAAIGLYYISRKLESILVTLAACTWLVAVSLITVMNYYFVFRPGVQ
jgi:hypothetical protein